VGQQSACRAGEYGCRAVLSVFRTDDCRTFFTLRISVSGEGCPRSRGSCGHCAICLIEFSVICLIEFSVGACDRGAGARRAAKSTSYRFARAGMDVGFELVMASMQYTIELHLRCALLFVATRGFAIRTTHLIFGSIFPQRSARVCSLQPVLYQPG
jgi:hypothetical protein